MAAAARPSHAGPSPTLTGLPIRTTLSHPRGGRREEDATAWGYRPRPGSPPPCRDVLRFVQALDLSSSVTTPRRDLQNGYLVAEMLARIYPGEVRMYSFNNGVGERVRRDNWEQIAKVAKRRGLALPGDLVEGVMAGRRGAAAALLELLYEAVTGKRVQRMPALGDIPGLEQAAVMPAALSCGEAAGDAGALKAMRPQGGAGGGEGAAAEGAPTFGTPQTQPVGDAMALRRKFGVGL